jgi:hypothetical protein
MILTVACVSLVVLFRSRLQSKLSWGSCKMIVLRFFGTVLYFGAFFIVSMSMKPLPSLYAQVFFSASYCVWPAFCAFVFLYTENLPQYACCAGEAPILLDSSRVFVDPLGEDSVIDHMGLNGFTDQMRSILVLEVQGLATGLVNSRGVEDQHAHETFVLLNIHQGANSTRHVYS